MNKNLNIENLSLFYKNKIELKNNDIEFLSKELNELNDKIKEEEEKKQLLLLESKKIKEIYSTYNKIGKEGNMNNINDLNNDIKNNNIFKKKLKNKLIFNACKFYNNVNNIFHGNEKNLINTNKYNEDLNDNINLLYELETKFQIIEKNIFQ